MGPDAEVERRHHIAEGRGEREFENLLHPAGAGGNHVHASIVYRRGVSSRWSAKPLLRLRMRESRGFSAGGGPGEDRSRIRRRRCCCWGYGGRSEPGWADRCERGGRI